MYAAIVVAAIMLFLTIFIKLNNQPHQQPVLEEDVFDEKDYQSSDGMMTPVWGPALWHYLHTMSFNYPTNPSQKDKENYRNFVLSLQKVLPCKYCRDNFEDNLKVMPLTDEALSSRKSFSMWMYNLHEMVNKRLGKESNLTYLQVRNRYEHFRSRCINQTKQTHNEDGHEKGCTAPLYGKKSKCIIKIVPNSNSQPSFSLDRQCTIKRLKL